MKIFSDIKEVLSVLRFVDIVFFFAVLILMLLIVTLIYFIKINKEEPNKKEDKKLGETTEMKIVRELKENMSGSEKAINFTDYEKDQEDKAIISYDELVDKSNKYELNYEKEEMFDDLSVKKVDLDNIVNRNVEVNSNLEVRVISFAKEEAFLQALKRLQQELG